LKVAGQQGAYVARMINRGYTIGVGGLDQAPPLKVQPAAEDNVDADALRKLKKVDVAGIGRQERLSEMDIMAVVNNDSTYLKVGAGWE